MTTVEKVLNAIKEDLFLNRLKPGQRIKEYALSKRLTVSRSPVREALQRLSAEGLVTLVPRKGAFVVRFSSHQLAELFEVREVIDGIAASLAAVRADSIHIQGLFDCLEMAKSILTRDDIPYYPFDLDFHQKVLGASGNGLLQKIGYDIHAQLRLARSVSGYKPSRALEAYEEHRAVLDNIKARDPLGAEKAMRHHVRNALGSVMKLFQDEEWPHGSKNRYKP